MMLSVYDIFQSLTMSFSLYIVSYCKIVHITFTAEFQQNAKEKALGEKKLFQTRVAQFFIAFTN